MKRTDKRYPYVYAKIKRKIKNKYPSMSEDGVKVRTQIIVQKYIK